MQQTVTTIQGERVLLRPFHEGDAEEAARVWTPELRYMYGGSRTAPRHSPEQTHRTPPAQPAPDENDHRFAIETGGRCIGHVGLRTNDDECGGHYRVGIENPEYWGRGYGTEVTRLVLRYAFGTLDLHRVSLKVAAYNLRARRCYEKCGFRVEGVLRESFQVDGEWQDDILMAILKDEWTCRAGSPNPAEAATGGLSPTIRTYRPSDYEQVSAIWQSEWGEGRPADAPAALTYKLTNDRGPFLVAELGGRIIGTALGSWDGRWAWVTRLAVHPDSRRRGIAKLLMAEAERRLAALGANFAALLVGAGNAGALALLYESLGYQRRDDVAFMVKRFPAREEPCSGPQPG